MAYGYFQNVWKKNNKLVSAEDLLSVLLGLSPANNNSLLSQILLIHNFSTVISTGFEFWIQIKNLSYATLRTVLMDLFKF